MNTQTFAHRLPIERNTERRLDLAGWQPKAKAHAIRVKIEKLAVTVEIGSRNGGHWTATIFCDSWSDPAFSTAFAFIDMDNQAIDPLIDCFVDAGHDEIAEVLCNFVRHWLDDQPRF